MPIRRANLLCRFLRQPACAAGLYPVRVLYEAYPRLQLVKKIREKKADAPHFDSRPVLPRPQNAAH